MIRRPFIIFNLVVCFLVAGILLFLQTPQFAGVLKSVATRYVPKDLGVTGDFTEISVQFYPPGFSLKNPKLWVKERNPVGLPGGSSVEAKKIDFTFRPLQIFSGNIRVHEVGISDGEVRLPLDLTQGTTSPSAPHGAPSRGSVSDLSRRFHWDELFQIRADGVVLENVQIRLGPDSKHAGLQGLAKSVRLGRSDDPAGLGYALDLELTQIEGRWLELAHIPAAIDALRVKAKVNATGIVLEECALTQAGLRIETPGKLNGDVLNLQDRFEADLRLRASGDLSSILKGFQTGKGLLLHGQVVAEGAVRGNLLRPMESLHVTASVQGSDLQYQAWKAKQGEAELSWNASPSGGVVNFERVVLSSPTVPRLGAEQPGDGGRLTLGPAQWEVNSQQPVKVMARFEHAHLHWLGAPAIESLFSLDFRLNGESQITYRPKGAGGSWEVQANLQNWLEDFQLDNQLYHQPRPLNTVFKIPRITLSGDVLLDSSGVRPKGLDIMLPHSVLRTTGKLDFKTGYDLHASGNLEWDDLGKISGSDVRGKGGVTVHVHGAPVAVLVDIDLDVKNAHYLNLDLGSIRGRMTWDDHLNHLIFSKDVLVHGETEYFVDGLIATGANDQVNLDVRIPNGNIHDFIQIFGHLTKDLWWFPHSLSGPFDGSLKVRGGVSFQRLVVSTAMEGRDWRFLGERFKSVHLTGGYDRGKYLVDELKAIKRTGQIEASVSLDAQNQIQWKVETQDLNVLDFDLFAQSDVPLRGDVTFRSEGKGPVSEVESATDFSLTRFSVRGAQMASSSASLKTSDGVARWVGSYFGGQAEVNALYDLNPRNLSSVRLALNHLDFSPLLLLMNKKNMQDTQLAGLVSGIIDLRFKAGSLEKANGSVQIADYLLASSDVRFQLERPVQFSLTDGNFEVNQLSMVGKSKRVTLDLKNRNDFLSGRIQGELDDSWIYFFLPSVTQVRGSASLDFAIGGTFKQPSLEGEMKLNGGELRVEALESPFENFSGKILVKQNALDVQDVSADLGGGHVKVNGKILMSAQKSPEIHLNAKIQEAKVKVYPFQYAKMSGQLGIGGQAAPYLIDGSIAIDSALFREKMLSQKRSPEGIKAIQYLPAASAKGEVSSSLFALNIRLEAPNGLIVQNDLFRDVVAKGQMTLVNTWDAPRVMGRLEIDEGKLIFKDHVFKIQSASALFDSPTVINPSFDLIAKTEASGVKIQMYATGRKNDMKIEMTASPAMPEAEIFSLLALGLTSSDAKKLSSTDLGLIQQGEAASLVLHSLEFNRELEDRTGLQVRVDESINQQQGVSAFRTPGQNDSNAAPQITVKKKFGDRFSVSAGSTVGFGSSRSNQLNLDYAVNPELSINGLLNNYGSNASVLNNGLSSSTDTQSTQTEASFGLDLKFLTRFR